MIILFPKRKGVKIATTLIFKEMQQPQTDRAFILGMIHFAFAFGAITKSEQTALIEYLDREKS